MKNRHSRYAAWGKGTGLFFFLIVSMIVGLQCGSAYVPLDVIYENGLAVINGTPLTFTPGMTLTADSSVTSTVLWDVRAPRIIYAALAGAGLSLVGLFMQTLTRNALADPYVLGVSSGAGMGAVFAIIVGGLPLLGEYNVPLFAFSGAVLAVVLVLLCVGRSQSPVKLILIGMGMSGIFSALTMLIIYGAKHEAQVRSAMFWLLGSLSAIQWPDLPLTAAALVLLFIYAFCKRSDLDVLLLGDHDSQQLGLNVKRLQLSLVITSSLMVAILVSKMGVVGFVGLIVPHLARKIYSATHGAMLPFVGLIGALVMVWSDTLARTLYTPEEIPIGVLTSLVGAPVFIWIIRKRYGHDV